MAPTTSSGFFISCIFLIVLLGVWFGLFFGLLMKEVNERATYIAATCTVKSTSVVSTTCSTRTCSSGGSSSSSHCTHTYYSCYYLDITATYTPTKAPQAGKQIASIDTSTANLKSTVENLQQNKYKNNSTFSCYYDPKDYQKITIGKPSIVAGSVTVAFASVFLLLAICTFFNCLQSYCSSKFPSSDPPPLSDKDERSEVTLHIKSARRESCSDIPIDTETTNDPPEGTIPSTNTRTISEIVIKTPTTFNTTNIPTTLNNNLTTNNHTITNGNITNNTNNDNNNASVYTQASTVQIPINDNTSYYNTTSSVSNISNDNNTANNNTSTGDYTNYSLNYATASTSDSSTTGDYTSYATVSTNNNNNNTGDYTNYTPNYATESTNSTNNTNSQTQYIETDPDAQNVSTLYQHK